MKEGKILFIIPFLPYPLISGGHQALYNGIAAISDSFDIYIAYEATDNDDYLRNAKEFLRKIPQAHLLPLLNMEREPSYWHRGVSRIKQSVRKRMGIKDTYDKEGRICHNWIKMVSPLKKNWLEHISRICIDNSFDIIQVEMPWMISQILTLPNDSKKIFVHHELGFVRRNLEMLSMHKTPYSQACKSLADIVEIDLLNKYDAILTLSPIDKKKLLAHGVSIPIYSSFSTIEMLKRTVQNVGNGKRLTFVGADSHLPNYIGIKWFLENCWSKILNFDGDYKLSIIGRWAPKNIEEILSAYTGIEFLGFVESLDVAIRGTVMIVPITIGSGIRMKILEACSIGVPFVSTPIGAEGIPVIDGENCFIADTPDLFLQKILKLRDVTIQQKIVENAYEMVHKNYSRKALTDNRLEIYKTVLSSL